MLGLLAVATIGFPPFGARASMPLAGEGRAAQMTSIAAAPGGGFWIQKDTSALTSHNGETIVYGEAPVFDNVSTRGSIAAIPGREGYWIVGDRGEIFARGDAPQLCGGELSSCSGFPAGPHDYMYIVAAAANPTGDGLRTVGKDGKVWTAGSTVSYGDVQNEDDPPTGLVATPSGKGCYIVTSDGSVYTFGDAVFHGSTGGSRPAGREITGMALSIATDGQVNGYWLVGEDGGVHTFGSAPFWGSTGGDNGGETVTNIVSFPAPVPGQAAQATKGYAWVHKNGHVGQATEDAPR
ncbi:MAG: hypothetical protein JO232_02060 [Verrucomicrobia bacterium]|nr:hypothetical protein [Verrucomicrobiota bacterium]